MRCTGGVRVFCGVCVGGVGCSPAIAVYVTVRYSARRACWAFRGLRWEFSASGCCFRHGLACVFVCLLPSHLSCLRVPLSDWVTAVLMPISRVAYSRDWKRACDEFMHFVTVLCAARARQDHTISWG